MNLSICRKCGKPVPVVHVQKDSREYLRKDCPECGQTLELISNDAVQYNKKRDMMSDHEYPGCDMDCLACKHKDPNIIFIETTNRCNMNCPICITNVPSMGFEFEPGMEYFDRIFRHFSGFEFPPSVQLFGGEPTMRDDIFDVIKLARSYGLSVRLVTNGLKLADQEYCDKAMTSGASVLIAFDGLKRKMYEVLRGFAGSLDLKLKALENISRHKNGKVVLMTVVDKNMNADDMPRLLEYCQDNSEILRGIFLMPLTQVWSEDRLDYEPERTTQEDVENIVQESLGEKVEFVPLGSLEFKNLARIFKVKHMPFLGVHPNCESFTLLVSNGKEYTSLARYMKTSLFDFVEDLRKVDKWAGKYKGSTSGVSVKTAVVLRIVPLFLKHFNFGAVVGAKGPRALTRWAGIVGAALTGNKLKSILKERTRVKGILQLLLLPFEDDYTVESERLEKCTSCFAYIDVKTDTIKSIPFCIWEKYKKVIMKDMAEEYNKEGYEKGLQRKAVKPEEAGEHAG